jgi:hypothetical protein
MSYFTSLPYRKLKAIAAARGVGVGRIIVDFCIPRLHDGSMAAFFHVNDRETGEVEEVSDAHT